VFILSLQIAASLYYKSVVIRDRVNMKKAKQHWRD
jgi:hypothetical protein